jgi:tetratricopeptide (TPR) repeat protein
VGQGNRTPRVHQARLKRCRAAARMMVRPDSQAWLLDAPQMTHAEAPVVCKNTVVGDWLTGKTLEMDPNFAQAHLHLGEAYEQTGMYAEAIAEFQKARQLDHSPEVSAALGHAFAMSGKRGEAQKVLDELKQLSKQRYVSPYYVALIYTGLGDKDQGLEWLRKASEDGSNQLAARIKVEPMFDSLRSDPRFSDLLRRMDFTP